MEMKFLHICSDEKFIDSAIDQFDLFKNIESIFFIYSKTPEPLYIKKRGANIMWFHDPNLLLKSINAQEANFVVLHSLCLPIFLLCKIQHEIIWLSWGFDIYSDIHAGKKNLIQLSLFKPQTRKSVYSFKKILKNKTKRLLIYLGIKSSEQYYYDKLTSRINYLSTPLPEEFSLIHDKIRTFIPFSYRSISPCFCQKLIQEKSGNNDCILVGNSLDPTNNHIDILAKLESYKKNFQVIIPISYSGSASYKERLKDYISKLTYLKCSLLESFIEKNEYFKLLSNCQISIFGHIRQQALGNIAQMLYQGNKVFLYKDSICYKHYKSKGYHIYTIEYDLNTDFMSTPLSQQEIKANRDFIIKDNDLDAYLNEIKTSFSKL